MSSTPQQSQHISIPDLRSDLNGEVIGPDDAAYDEARQVFFKASTADRPRWRGSPARMTSLASSRSPARAASSWPSAAAATAAQATGPAKAGS